MKFHPYPEYKDSGVPWLGKIPAHWDIKPGMAFISQRKEKNVGMKESTVLSLLRANSRQAPRKGRADRHS